jgi:DNA polymerase-3 subunit alpha (Gram-positive type)
MEFYKDIVKIDYRLPSKRWSFFVNSALNKEIKDTLFTKLQEMGYHNPDLIFLKDVSNIKNFLIKIFPILEKTVNEFDIKDDDLIFYIDNEFANSLIREKSVDVFIHENLRLNLRVIITPKNVQACYKDIESLFVSKAMEKRTDLPKKDVNILLLGKDINGATTEIRLIKEEEKDIIVEGEIFDVEFKSFNSGRHLLTFYLTDYSNTIFCKQFIPEEKILTSLKDHVKEGSWLVIRGYIQHDNYVKELCVFPKDIVLGKKPQRIDMSEEKRIELHCHTQFSSLDGVLGVKELVERAALWGHKSIAITDHGVLQAFPEAYKWGKEYNVKIIYGVEGYLIDDEAVAIANPDNAKLKDILYVALDIETTGLSPRNDEIIEISAVKFKNGLILDNYSTFVKPTGKISSNIENLTGINNDMVKNAPELKEVLGELLDFIGNLPITAHNLPFDLGFIQSNLSYEINNPLIDTMELSKKLLPDRKSYKLSSLCQDLSISLENHHRAYSDASACGYLLNYLFQIAMDKGISTLAELGDEKLDSKGHNYKSYHVILLAKNQKGLKNLYKLVSHSHIKHFHRNPRIPKSLLKEFREGILVGSACESGELYQEILRGAGNKKLKDIALYYDYLEIQPLGNNQFLVNNGQVKSTDDLIEINKRIVDLGKSLNRPVIATGDVHFLDPHDEVFRRIIMAGQGFVDADNQAPLYFKTTDEMLLEFDYLGESCRDVVIFNPIEIDKQIDSITPIKLELNSPKIETAKDEIRLMSQKKVKELYGEDIPSIVHERLDHELNSIINNGFSEIYLISQRLVKKSLDDGYLVGSRGSVGSSFVAYLCGITEVNPLSPHYLCRCHYTEFVRDIRYQVGPDLLDKACPICNTVLTKQGFNIPFEVFMGFEGNKVPDIDLNFSGKYQPNAHKYAEDLLGKEYVFRAGTIATIAEKTAFGFVKNYIEDRKYDLNQGETKRLVKGLTGIKRTTGQHPGGLIVIPQYGEVYDYTPIQYPADDKNSGVITTHFDYHSIHDCLLKLDILGHDDPTVIKMLEDITGVSAEEVPLDDEETMKIFYGSDGFPLTSNELELTVGTLGIPEFGTRFVRQMLKQTKPKTFSELIRISGLSHGTNVWLNNAHELIKDNTASLREVISTRDDIMTYLNSMGLPSKDSFNIMERVRKGKGLTQGDMDLMKKHNVPDWYINSCNKISYMFPKAHAVAYVIMAFRIAYFKVHHPLAFYTTYFTVRADDFDSELIIKGKEEILKKIKEIERKGNTLTQKEKNLLTILEVSLEMNMRGFNFCPIDLYESDPFEFKITSRGLLPPLNSLQGLGNIAAQNISLARSTQDFISIEDLQKRGKLSKTVIEILQRSNCLNQLPERNQLTLFNLA